MSIIQEALKKFQGTPEDKKTGGFDTGRYEEAQYGYREKRSAASLLFLVIVLLAAASLYFFKNVFPNVKHAAVKPQTAVPVAAPAAAGAEEKITAPLQIQVNEPVAKAPDPAFILSGIMMPESGPRAIINGTVVEEGDMIGGASVEYIESEKVLLKYKDESITLKLK